MRTRVFTTVTVAMFAWALFFAGMAGAQETTESITGSAGTTTADTTTTDRSSALPETTTAGSQAASSVDRSADNFRCVDVLRIIRNPTRHQYNVSSQRIQQCRSRDVLANTIPRSNLPNTGGSPPLGLAALGVAALVAGASVFRAGMRRRR
jgi:LPXTG-motif cell wall-anchored protein